MKYFKVITHTPLEDNYSYIAGSSLAEVVNIVDGKEPEDPHCYRSVVEISQDEWFAEVGRA